MLGLYKRTFLLLDLIAIILFVFNGCSHQYGLRGKIKEEKLASSLEKLIQLNPDYFNHRFTLIIMLDSKACSGNLAESKWWPIWLDYAKKHNIGYVFVTSLADSTDLAFAIQLEDIAEPVLVMPGYDNYVSDLWNHPSLILKLLYDNNSKDYYTWAISISDLSHSDYFLSQIDSITHKE